MIWGEFREVAMKSIVAPGDIAERMKRPHVVELAASTKRLGGTPGNVMWVRKVRGGWQLIAGRDRYSANTINGVKADMVRVVEQASPEEVRALERHENLHRRADDRDKLIAEELKALTAIVEAEQADDAGRNSSTNVEKLPGRPKAPVTIAAERLAARLNTTPAAVKQAASREEVKEREAGEAGAGVSATGHAAPPPPIDCYGHPLPDRVALGLARIVGALKKAEQLNRQAIAALGELDISTLDPAVQSHVLDAFKEAGARARAAMPTHLCPYCYGEPVKCKGCREEGWVTASVFAAAPAERRGPTEPGSRNLLEQNGAVVAPIASMSAPIEKPTRNFTMAEIARAAFRMPMSLKPKPRPGPKVQIGDGPLMDIDQAEAAIAAMNSDDEREEIEDGSVPF